MSQADSLLPISTQTTVSTGASIPQLVENNKDSRGGNPFADLLKSNLTQSEAGKPISGQNPQTGNTLTAQGQDLPQDGNLLPVVPGFYILNKAGLLAGQNLSGTELPVQTEPTLPTTVPVVQSTTEDVEKGVVSEMTSSEVTSDAETASSPSGIDTKVDNKAEQNNAGTEVLSALESKQSVPVTTNTSGTETQTATDSARTLSSRSALPEASVVGQQKAVENILKHSSETDNSETEVELLPENARDASARLAALMQKHNHSPAGNTQAEKNSILENTDAERLIQEITDGKKLLDSEQVKTNTSARTVMNTLGAGISNDLAQNLNQSQILSNQSGFQVIGSQAPSSNSASVISQAPVIDMPLKQQGWDEAMGQRVMWQINQKIQRADIRMNPPHLGPLEVRISMTEEGANISFSSHHGVVRETVEASIPKLREMLEEQGITLANADVSEQSVAQQNYQGETGDGNDSSAMRHDSQTQDNENVLLSGTSTMPLSDRMLDLFA
ncbi:MAG: flagellar hook-length control protein FliK [Gammaproteobacteria bacterium]|nr:flagellar hook-length control protein FliK [Gammaproteobacteria bacterium]MDH5594633.1 flagellar hook-length control protein FliK [Gammaproteobacteria bacterium]MDH5613999.1 flagellar hook-length control protein FliK [Gammaproteobacteria bacterium]